MSKVTNIIKKPLITEKSAMLAEGGKYAFVVDENTTKNEVKKAVKDVYNVDAINVNILNLHPKSKRFKNIPSLRGGFKKAIVTLKEGQKIEIVG
ncbi:MAG: 50S ribosomal protein L23 [bacterium]|nr:50S ribosomal protein L23 [bacterium]